MWAALLLHPLECARKEHFLHGQGCADKYIKQFEPGEYAGNDGDQTAEDSYLAGAGGAMMF